MFMEKTLQYTICCLWMFTCFTPSWTCLNPRNDVVFVCVCHVKDVNVNQNNLNDSMTMPSICMIFITVCFNMKYILYTMRASYILIYIYIFAQLSMQMTACMHVALKNMWLCSCPYKGLQFHSMSLPAHVVRLCAKTRERYIWSDLVIEEDTRWWYYHHCRPQTMTSYVLSDSI